ncbi:galactose-specific lectin nattectin [Etheostoma spectabile]|uniref:galactose-specific lectin nattectin n=1 Tax=Etheostoma spectabile TaxID=54343 RepID=UPI0013AFD2CA|nr:galactose-specific lectin nattectin-like [Etheostoma spectabile]
MASVLPLAVCLCLSSGLLAAYGAPPACPPDWTQFGSRCFEFYIEPKSWLDAETACIAAGGNLASIRSAAEHAFLKEFINKVSGTHKTTWIGGSDAVKEGTWLWSDGSRFKYKSWNVGQPDNWFGENCLLMNWPQGNTWNDWGCNNLASFVCSKNVFV